MGGGRGGGGGRKRWRGLYPISVTHRVNGSLMASNWQMSRLGCRLCGIVTDVICMRRPFVLDVASGMYRVGRQRVAGQAHYTPPLCNALIVMQ